MTTCGKCGSEYERGTNCPACNRRRVYAWRLANHEEWLAIQRASKRKRKPKPTRYCEGCGAVMWHRRADARYCTEACKKIHQQQSRPERFCRICGVSITHRFATARYCSEAHAHKGRRIDQYKRQRGDVA